MHGMNKTRRALRRLTTTLVALGSAVLLACARASTALAQGGGGGAGNIEGKIGDLTSQIGQIARPLGILSFSIIAIAFIVAPAAREWAENHKRLAGSVLFGLILITFVEDIVGFIMPAS